MLQYSISVSDWTEPRGYRDSGRGWRVCVLALPDDDWNAVGRRVHETFHRTLAKANKCAMEQAKIYGIEFTPR